jgi:hypothetical protein
MNHMRCTTMVSARLVSVNEAGEMRPLHTDLHLHMYFLLRENIH